MPSAQYRLLETTTEPSVKPSNGTAAFRSIRSPYSSSSLSSPTSPFSTARPNYWARSTPPRKKLLVFGAIVALLLVYMVWCVLATATVRDADDFNYSGKSRLRSDKNANHGFQSNAIHDVSQNRDSNSINDNNTSKSMTSGNLYPTVKARKRQQQQQETLPRGIAFLASPLLAQRLHHAAAAAAAVAAAATATFASITTTTTTTKTFTTTDVASTNTDDTETNSVPSKAARGGKGGDLVPQSPPSKSINTRPINESLNVCAEQFGDTRLYIQNRPRREFESAAIIYFVTPTYPRREQAAELTRLAHTLLHVPRLHWILANDYAACNVYLDYLINSFGMCVDSIPYTHLSSPMPQHFRKKKPMPRGVSNRRAAILWLRQRNMTEGVLYFGDDDNTYDLKLFGEIRETQRVSMFPVGLIQEYGVSGPVVRKGKVVGFLDSWVANRHWPVDMAGFAVNLAYMATHPNASMPYKPGYEEDYFLRSIALKLAYIELKGKNCTEILVWHTQTRSVPRSTVRIQREYLDNRSNLGALFKTLEFMGVSSASGSEGKKAIISKNGKAKPLEYFLS